MAVTCARIPRLLLNEINANHEDRTPEALARNDLLIRELNSNIAKVGSATTVNLPVECLESVTGGMSGAGLAVDSVPSLSSDVNSVSIRAIRATSEWVTHAVLDRQ